ncbi:MAG: corrinoid protein [Dehalococcoidia bacterium]|jgi:corrinoid protein of di/trimethylamine methyltransferase|nr:corrinoid protein [Dehalococcoidia bacterium]
MNNQLFEAMAKSVINGEIDEAKEMAQLAIKQGIEPLDAINNGFVTGMNYVGEQFGIGEMFLPELVMAAEAMKSAVAVLEPELQRQGTVRKFLGNVVIGTVKGDIHDIGKTLVATMLSASGFQVYDLGCDVSAETFLEKSRQVNADIVGLSSLLTTTMVYQKDIIKAFEKAGLRSRVKIIVGGAPISEDWTKEIGADGFSKDAFGAVALAKELISA